MPTICDLYGLSFNKNLTQGQSIFSDEIKNSIFFSSMNGCWDENCYTVFFDKYYLMNEENREQKISAFKEKINSFLEKQRYIEMYYRVKFI